MSLTVNCPYCQLPQNLPENPPATGEVYCSTCGVPLPRAAVRPATVLWIDDDPLLLGLCVGVLEKHGYRVLTAPDGAQGIAVAHAARPDVILLDVLMPTMNGIEVCRQLRTDATLHDTPIILLTALNDPGARPMGAKVGATATFRKP
jgi:CheY-like chemotaxis protein